MKQSSWIVRRLRDVIPVVQDPPREWIRKLAFWMALMVFISAGYFLLDELVWQPNQTMETVNTLRDWYHSDEEDDGLNDDGTPDTTVYPAGMDPAFKRLYRANSDVRGWLTFTCGSGSGDVFEGTIDNPVVQTTDNDYYLNRDFWGESDKAGTLFFDYRNDLGPSSQDRNRIIYGHNLTSGLMFSKFNKLATGNLDYGKRLTTLTLDTLYEKNTYKVIAVMVLNVEEADGPVFNYLRTQFSSEEAFLDFVEEIHRRSLFDFDVDVQAGDQLLTLSTCSNKRETTLKDGRVVIVARRVRSGEDAKVDSSKTVKNEDVLMPKAWYINKGLDLPAEYRTDATTTTPSGTPTTTPSSGTPSSGDDPTTSSGGSSASSGDPTDNNSTTPSSGDNTTPSGDITTPTSDGGDSTTPSGDDTTSSSEGGDSTTPSGDDTTSSSEGGDSTTPSGDDTTTSSDGGDSTTPSGDDTTAPSDDATTPSAEDTTTTEAPSTETTDPVTDPSDEGGDPAAE